MAVFAILLIISVRFCLSYVAYLVFYLGNWQDELEIVSKLLGKKGGYSGTLVLVRNKTTGELIAEGRHSLFGKHASKM